MLILLFCFVQNLYWKKYSNDVNEWRLHHGSVSLCLIFFFLWQRLYKENYEKTKAKSMNYCETPKYQLDTLLKSFSEVRKAVPTSGVGGLPPVWQITVHLNYTCFLFQTKYKDKYVQNILGHYIGSFEDPYETHCMKVSAQNSEVSLKTIVCAS